MGRNEVYYSIEQDIRQRNAERRAEREVIFMLSTLVATGMSHKDAIKRVIEEYTAKWIEEDEKYGRLNF